MKRANLETACEIAYKYYQNVKIADRLFGEDSSQAFQNYREYHAVCEAFAEMFDVLGSTLRQDVEEMWWDEHEEI